MGQPNIFAGLRLHLAAFRSSPVYLFIYLAQC